MSVSRPPGFCKKADGYGKRDKAMNLIGDFQ